MFGIVMLFNSEEFGLQMNGIRHIRRIVVMRSEKQSYVRVNWNVCSSDKVHRHKGM